MTLLAACTAASESSTTATTLGVEATDAPVSTVGRSARSLGSEPTYGSATVDGDSSEWSFAADFFADMFEAGKPDKSLLSKLYLRYACETETLYVLVVAEPEWLVINSDADNFVKLGNSEKLVDGSFGNDGSPPDFEYIVFEPAFSERWEASVPLAPGVYDNLNVHAQVVPRQNRSATSAVADRAIPIAIVCEATTTTSTPVSSTTTTVASTTTSTSGSSTTTTALVSSTTTLGATTTSSPLASSTTTSIDGTTSTIVGSTTTTLEVGGSSIATTTTLEVGGSTLPNTGSLTVLGPLSQAVWLALMLLLLGGLVVRIVKDRG